MLSSLGLTWIDIIVFLAGWAAGVPVIAIKIKRLKAVAIGAAKVFDAIEHPNGASRKKLIEAGIHEIATALPLGSDEQGQKSEYAS